ncbi:MAG TPA: DUF1206 domain-containing protein [Solirubrobacteraceae bacterium]|jgi:hypothetical protein
MSVDMSLAGAPARSAKARGERFARSDTFEWLARAGLAARGAVYGIIAILAIKLALGDGGKATNQQGALKTIAAQPFGKALLIVLAIGLLGYAAWRLTRAAIGHGRETTDDVKGRISGAVSGLGYAALFVTAVQIIAGSGGGGGSGQADKATGGALGWPGGPWLVGLVGLIIVAAGLDEGRRALTRSFCEKSRTERMSRRMRQAFTAAGVFGHLARMVVFVLMGYFLVRAAIAFDPDKAVGLDGALAKLAHAPYGPVLLGIVAVGLLGFAAYSALDARYRQV